MNNQNNPNKAHLTQHKSQLKKSNKNIRTILSIGQFIGDDEILKAIQNQYHYSLLRSQESPSNKDNHSFNSFNMSSSHRYRQGKEQENQANSNNRNKGNAELMNSSRRNNTKRYDSSQNQHQNSSNYNIKTRYCARSQKVILIKFHSETINKILYQHFINNINNGRIESIENIKSLNQIHVNNDLTNRKFYQEKSKIEIQKVNKLQKFHNKFILKNKKKEQDKLKKQLSSQMLEVKRGILKRYVTKTQQRQESNNQYSRFYNNSFHDSSYNSSSDYKNYYNSFNFTSSQNKSPMSLSSSVDHISSKQLSKILNKRKKKLLQTHGLSKNFNLPVVEVFKNHSQKKRTHQNDALSPLAIVKTRRNDQLFKKSQNILNRKQKSQLYEVKQWFNQRTHLKQSSISPSMKSVQKIIGQKRLGVGGFELLQMNRVINKIKQSLSTKKKR